MDEELCKNAIYSNEYYDLILDYIGGYSMGAPECIQQVDDTYDIGFYRRERAPELNLQDYPYLTIPHCLTPMDMTALEVSGMIRLQNPAALDLQGQGVLIGFVDTGINYEHPAFRNVDGSTRILGIWDQTQMEGPPPNGMSYGAFYGEEEINAALQAEQPQSIAAIITADNTASDFLICFLSSQDLPKAHREACACPCRTTADPHA